MLGYLLYQKNVWSASGNPYRALNVYGADRDGANPTGADELADNDGILLTDNDGTQLIDNT